MTIPQTTTLWRTQVKLIRYVGQLDEKALVWIPAMEKPDEHVIPSEYIPDYAMPGDIFYLRCTLHHDDFIVAPLRTKVPE